MDQVEKHDLPEGVFMFSLQYPLDHAGLLRFTDTLSDLGPTKVKKIIFNVETKNILAGELGIIDIAAQKLSKLGRPLLIVTDEMHCAEALMALRALRSSKTVVVVNGSRNVTPRFPVLDRKQKDRDKE